MPKKRFYERDLTVIAISRKAHDLIFRHKHRGEPAYHLLDLIVAAYYDKDNELRALQELYDQAIEAAKSWMQKYEQEKSKQSQLRFE